jgi:hypothetical protein
MICQLFTAIPGQGLVKLSSRLQSLNFWLSALGAFVTCFEFGLPHALPLKFDAIRVVYEAVKHGICKGGLANY